MLVALGLTETGEKKILGLRQGASENAAVCTALLEELCERGLDTSQPILAVLDGSQAGLDDQMEWLDDDTVIYGLARSDEPGVTDVWALDVAAGSTPRLLVPEA